MHLHALKTQKIHTMEAFRRAQQIIPLPYIAEWPSFNGHIFLDTDLIDSDLGSTDIYLTRAFQRNIENNLTYG